MKFMGAAGKRAQLRARRRPVGRLGKALGAERQRLIGAERQAAGHAARATAEAFSRASSAAIAPGACDGALRFQAALIEIGRAYLDRNAGGLKQCPPHLAA